MSNTTYDIKVIYRVKVILPHLKISPTAVGDSGLPYFSSRMSALQFDFEWTPAPAGFWVELLASDF